MMRPARGFAPTIQNSTTSSFGSSLSVPLPSRVGWRIARAPWRARLARVILELPWGHDPTASLPVTLSDLSGLSGVTTSQVDRELGSLEQRGVLRFSDGLQILDRPALVAVGSVA